MHRELCMKSPVSAGPFSSNQVTQTIGPNRQQSTLRTQCQRRHAMLICDQKIRTEWPWVKGREPMRGHLGIAMAGMLAGVVTAALAQQSSASSKDQKLITELAKKWEAAYNRKDAAG